MRIVLVQPPIEDFYDTDVRIQPIGLCYIKASIEQFCPDVEVIIRDYHQHGGRHTVPLPKALRYLQDYYPVADKSPFSAFHQYYHFGERYEIILQEITELKPDLLGISALFTAYFQQALNLAKIIKPILEVPIVMGGSHVSGMPRQVLTNDCIDYVIPGEAERPMVELIEYLQGKRRIHQVANLGYKKQGMIWLNPREDNYAIDEIPLPAVDALPLEQYQLANKAITFMITSRSCPHKCSFCSVHSVFGEKYQRRNIDNVLTEIELRYQQGFRVIDFEDDNLTFYKNEFKQLCQALIKRFPSRELEFVAMNGISYISLDNEMMELMKHAGFTSLNLALVSSDKSVRESTKRPHTIKKYLTVVNKGFELGFKMVSYQILGLPNETLASMVQTLAFNTGLPVLLGASPYYQTPNAPISAHRTFTDDDLIKARLTAFAIETEHFTRDDLYTLFISTRIINFIKGLTLSENNSLLDQIHISSSDHREQIGMQLLQQLIDQKQLFFYTKQKLIANKHFNVELFAKLLQQIDKITCLNGRQVDVKSFYQTLMAPHTHQQSPSSTPIPNALKNQRPPISCFDPVRAHPPARSGLRSGAGKTR